jgi:hypothetical protein
MSKHSSPEDKLHISPNLRVTKPLPKQKLSHQSKEPPGPPTGTNSKNQFR